MADREKLIELLLSGDKTVQCEYSPDVNCDGMKCAFCERVEIAGRLIANGVTFAKDTNVPSKWISVEEGLPDLIPCSAGTAYSEAVNILTSGRKVLTAVWDGKDFIADAEFWEAEGEEITHWAPVLLPLPEPPNIEKGDAE